MSADRAQRLPASTLRGLAGAVLPRAGTAFLVAVAGGVCTALWVMHASVPLVWQQAERFRWGYALPAVGLTMASVTLRFTRWHYLLRRLGVRLPIRTSVGIFVAGLAMLLTPAYAGEAIKVWLAARAARGSARRTAVAVLAERAMDVVALAAVGGAALLASGESRPGGLMAAGAAAGALVVTGAALAGTRTKERRGGTARGVALALGMSAAAWAAGSLVLWVVGTGLGLDLMAVRAAGAYAAATLLGAATLLPAGIGVVGSAVVVYLQRSGAPEPQAVLGAVLTRLFTVWLTAALGIAGAWRVWRHLGAADLDLPGEGARFDALAPAYSDQLPAAARARVVARKVSLMADVLRATGIGVGARVLDAGSGPGWYTSPMAACGYRLSAVDLSPAQARLARASTTEEVASAEGASSGGRVELVTAASILGLPFQDQVFDAAFSTNVLHHAGDPATHGAALAELARVVRPGGLVFVHEINTRNPLFGAYMSYLFPLLKRIDTGTEHWLDPRRLPSVQGVTLDSVVYYTFLPDFTPAPLYGVLERLERRLEQSPLRPYSAHFSAVYRRLPASSDVEISGPLAAHARAQVGSR